MLAQHLSPTTRIAIATGCLVMAALWIALVCGMVPDKIDEAMASRKALSENVALHYSVLATRGLQRDIESGLEAMVRRNRDLVSAAVRRVDGGLELEVGDHEKHWSQEGGATPSDQVVVPLIAGNEQWGTVELRFLPLLPRTWLPHPAPLLMFVTSLVILANTFYLRRVLTHLDPSRVVPARVRSALDSLTEGLVLLDRQQRIVLANEAFCETVQESREELHGRHIGDFLWSFRDEHQTSFPWERALQHQKPQTREMLGLEQQGEHRIFLVNSTPIVADNGSCQGALASFEDMTILEEKRAELKRLLSDLQQSRDEIHRQNQELQILATRDPLTGCLNRRSLFETFDKLWHHTCDDNRLLACVMVDIDHFKPINDNHGHAKGDVVLRTIGRLLRHWTTAGDCVGRYGGEEFCVLLPERDSAAAREIAEQIRRAIESESIDGLEVTASLGVSAREFRASDPQELLDQADRALYFAKRNGRNQTALFSEVPPSLEEEPLPRSEAQSESPGEFVQFQAVSALLATLAFRDRDTAEHSGRVADLCVTLARTLMSPAEICELEMAALLHDIGKIGVPDSVLLKPGQLTQDEWTVMSAHDKIGVEIVRSTFPDDPIADIIAAHHCRFDEGGPDGKELPLAARIITICDAFDAMVSDRVYRKGMSLEEAFAELRRHAGTQFDPDLVERLIAIMEADVKSSRQHDELSKQAAMHIRDHVRQLAEALDRNDLQRVPTLAAQLAAVAAEGGATDIAETASRLALEAAEDPDLASLVDLISDLVNLCRTARRSLVQQVSSLQFERQHDRPPAVTSGV